MTDSTIPIIDTHQHLWVRSVLDLEWTKGAGSLDDDFPIERYAREAAGMGVAKTIYMEVNCRLEQQQCEVGAYDPRCGAHGVHAPSTPARIKNETE